MIFSKLLSDSSILQSLKDQQSALIIGCPWCAGFSIAYQKNLPYLRKSTNKDTGETEYLPAAILDEANRIKALLEEQGISTRVQLYPGPCLYSTDIELPESVNGGDMASPEMLHSLNEADAVLSLCCTNGTMGLRKRVSSNVRVVPGMVTAGIGQFGFKFDETKKHVYVDQDETTVSQIK